MHVIVDPRVQKEMSKLSDEDVGQITSIIEFFEIYGFQLTEPYIKKLTGNIWELRTGRWRILIGFVTKNTVAVNLFYKSTKKTPIKEIKLAEKRLKDYL